MFTASTELERYAWLSIAAALATITLKTLAWWLTGSVSLLSDALESIVNLAAALLALTMLRVAASPPDENHPYGFSKAEYFAAGIEGALIVLAAGGILASAIPRLVEPQPIQAPLLGLALSAAASGINLGVGMLLIRVGRREHSIALEADGHHLMTDVWTSAGVIAGVALVFLTGWLRLDPLVALAVAVHIVWIGLRLMRRSWKGLLDAAISIEDTGEVTRLFTEYSKRYGVSFHALRTRQAGARRFISFHFLVPDAWTVAQAHRLSEEVEARIRSMVPNAAVFTHIEPISDPSSYDDQELDR
ncbi:MAG TPA: cation diffusion facilitator family transporter [Burkholderiales bacterium]|jgi:cation diffusion facilitator family transporter|nr:cation diffusion facilitator family transporter [Burkholderiales bacterium]